MSTISVTQKGKTLSSLDHRNVSLIILAALVTMLVTVVALTAAAPASKSSNYNAYMLHRRGEWVSVPVSSEHAYQIFRRGEVTSPSYPQSERVLVNPAAGLAIYHASERTLIDPLAGMKTYWDSERTRIPVRFNTYQRSEWFGE
jgi:hypothetical protein